MNQARQQIVIGTRHSQLALWQTEYVAEHLRALYPDLTVTLKHFETHGDRVLDKPLPEIGGKGVFTAELENALVAGEIDLAVHSLKDLPTELDDRFVIGAVPPRASPYDALISRHRHKLADLPRGAVVGTSSLRRVAQLRANRPDLSILSLRGNVPTRIAKARSADGPYDAIVLAQAGLDRLDMAGEIAEILSADVMLPAPAQGALAIQCRADDLTLRQRLAPLDHTPTRIAVVAERTFLNALDSGCRLPVAALAHLDGTTLHITGRVSSLDGTQVITVQDECAATLQDAVILGARLAQAARARGADALLDAIRGDVRA